MVLSQGASWIARRHKVTKIVFIVLLTITLLSITVQVLPRSLVLQWTLNRNPFATIRYFNKTSNQLEIVNSVDKVSDNFRGKMTLSQSKSSYIKTAVSNTDSNSVSQEYYKKISEDQDKIVSEMMASKMSQETRPIIIRRTPNNNNNNDDDNRMNKTKTTTPQSGDGTTTPLQPITTLKGSGISDMDREEKEEDACVFPTQDPTHPVIMKHFKSFPDIVCKDSLPNIVYRDEDTLRINASKARDLGLVIDYCNYTSLTLGDTSDCRVQSKFTSKTFNNSIKIPLEHEHLIVSCFLNEKNVAKSYFAIIRKKPAVEERSEQNYKNHIEKNSPRETLSVLLVGLDGTSRQNFIRAMPKTRRYILTEMDAVEMFKFNMVGKNTFQNVIAMLSGKSEPDVLKYWEFKRPMDELDDIMLFKDYRDAGYRTAMLLDSVRITSFHYAKRGWVHPPWDYYYRPLVIATRSARKDNMHCMGNTPEVTFQMDYWHQLTSLFNNTKTKPYFAYSFNQRITHNDCNKATQADKIYLEFFKSINERNVLNNTLLIFFSDHGERFGPIRQTHAGILESRTPFLFLMFPPWFRTKYPDLMKAMHTNQRRLTTMFDVHATLKDLLYFKAETGTGNLDSRGISLFKEIPKERLCSHSGIPLEHCMCTKMTRTKISQKEKDSITFVLAQHIEKLTERYRKLCAKLEMVEAKSIVKIQGDLKCTKCAYYGVTIKMEPGGGVFEGTVMHNQETNTRKVIGSVVRVNMYRDQADCMKILRFKSFCFCK